MQNEEPQTQRQQPPTTSRRVVVNVRRRRQARRRVSRGAEPFDALARSLLIGSYGVSRAVTLALRRYIDERDRSARRRRDGALEDFAFNAADALGTLLGESRNVPRDVVRSFETPSVRRMIRRSIRSARRLDRRMRRMEE